MHEYVVDLQDIDRTSIPIAGGKAANLGELLHIDGVLVPPGFCVTTDAFVQAVNATPDVAALIDALHDVDPEDHNAIRDTSARIRASIESAYVPNDIANAITQAVARIGADTPCAVRSSATAEDLPHASFAGQQDTYLNVSGAASILEHVRRCWASLFTDRAVTYRTRNGIDHRAVRMAVVVQRMVFPATSGILFTADPSTGNRKVAYVEASFGLGEALVSGIVNADSFRVRDGAVAERSIASKHVAIEPAANGGTHERAIEPSLREQPALSDARAVQLVNLGRRIEAHFGQPQDIEWVLADDAFHIVQSRAITTLFPIPVAADDGNHVYLSSGHQQMMTDAMKPLGLSLWQKTTPRPMAEAGGRLFVDVTNILAAPASRANFVGMWQRFDPLIGDALEAIVDRDGFLPQVPDAGTAWAPPGTSTTAPIETSEAIVRELIDNGNASIARAAREIETKSGGDVFDFILSDMQEMKRVQFEPRSMQVILAGMDAATWLNRHMEQWLGEKNAADVLTQSVPHNITSEMGLALLDVADAIRPHPEVVAFLENAHDDGFLDRIVNIPGGAQARDAIQSWLDRFGMRGVGEIDITRPRWAERPSMLLPMILANVRGAEPGAAARRFEAGLREASAREQELLARLRALPDGEVKAAETKRMIDRVRTFAGYREYPKYGMINRYFIYKKALLKEAERLVRDGVLHEVDDAYFLRFEEMQHAVEMKHVDQSLIRRRREDYAWYQSLTPPRVLTSEGEAVRGNYRREDLPAGALVGLAVSGGTVEGRARVILDVADADLEPGDILVTAFTDPSWTTVFVSISGLVTEVGGLMTHGSVIAREFGLPAVVGVENATRRIRDGQRIRVHGTEGYVEILSD